MSNASADLTLPASDDDFQREWNNDLDPIATVASGAVVHFECPDAREGQFDLDTTLEDVQQMDHDRGMPLVGPLAIEGLEAGDVLEIEILDVAHGDVGWTLFYPGERGFGLLPEEFPDWGLHVWDLSAGVGEFVDGIEVPLAPFPGTIGLAPAESGSLSTTPPRAVGGNMDTKYLTEGATLYLPVEVDGGLFAVGDGHGTQGDGEVCGGAIETAIDVTCRFERRTDLSIDQPQFRPGKRPEDSRRPTSTYATTGVADDLMVAAKRAVSGMVEHLHDHHGLTREQAYILCSVAGDLTINEIVDEPNYVVSVHVDEALLSEA
ncbi:acetamidase/formamidase family protein [Salinirubrum litoreum]|uniref:Acetamidase/formamidase family protein n=1 Tax=Salinirubrum litoreum TaxID=1126234 RepID=A0ABD5RGQ9_9EURY|nr:acetamidase/formamidase family protein [Salinirubrum litoreum]